MALTKVSSSMKSAPTSAEVQAHATDYDDASVRNDIATLALHSAIADNKAAYNLSNAFIDQFESDAGIDTETTCDRSDSEFMASVVVGTGGSNSGIWDSTATQGLRYAADSRYEFAGDLTVEWGQKTSDAQASSRTGVWGTTDESSWTADAWHVGYASSNIVLGINSNNSDWDFTFASSSHDGSWHHMAFVRDSGTFRAYRDGVASTVTVSNGNTIGDPAMRVCVGAQEPGASESFNGLLDNVRISNSCRYPSGTSFTVPGDFTSDANTMLLLDFENASFNAAHGATATSIGLDSNIGSVTRGTDVPVASSTNATGNWTSTTQTSAASVSSMGIVVLYKENSGSTVLNTDLVCEISANGGTNYSNATLVAGGTFSSGIKIAAVSGVSVTAGTAPKYKISFANQASGTKETQVHGVALLY